MIKLTIKLMVILSLIATGPTTVAQRLRLLADVEILGEGLESQTITYGNYTNTESITGMSGLSVGLNLGLPFRFESSLTVGGLLHFGLTSTTSSSGNTSTSTSFAIPKIGLELSRSFIWNEEKFVSGLNFGFGIERYWPGTFSSSVNGDQVKVSYKGAIGQYFRIKLVFREGKRLQLEPHLTYRHFDLVADDYSQTSSTGPLHPSMENLQVRNISVGVNILLGFSKKNP